MEHQTLLVNVSMLVYAQLANALLFADAVRPLFDDRIQMLTYSGRRHAYAPF